MVNRGQLVIGSVLVLMGVLFLIGTIFQIDVGAICWPVGLIVLGVWLVARPRMVSPDSGVEVQLLGDVRRKGSWQARNEEIWLGVADVELDYSDATLPPGETKVTVYGFVGDVDMYVPSNVGVSVRVMGAINESELLGRKEETFFSPAEATSANYLTAESRIRVEMYSFVADIKVKHI